MIIIKTFFSEIIYPHQGLQSIAISEKYILPKVPSKICLEIYFSRNVFAEICDENP